MSDIDSQMSKINLNIRNIIGRKRLAILALCVRYAAVALKNFREKQARNAYWTNRTNTAYNTVFSGTITYTNILGFFLSHLEEYGIYLELANDRKNESLRPEIFELEKEFMEDLKRLVGDD